MQLTRATLGVLFFFSLFFLTLMIFEKRLSLARADIMQLKMLFHKNQEQEDQLTQLKKNLVYQQEQTTILEKKFSAMLLNLQSGKNDPASEDLVRAILATKHDTLLLIEHTLADLLKAGQQQAALTFIAQTQLMNQQEKLKIASYFQHHHTWEMLEHDIKEQVKSQQGLSKQQDSYIAWLGIKVEEPLSEDQQQQSALIRLLEEKNYQQVCSLSPWKSLTQKQARIIEDLCHPLPIIQQQLIND
jgi:hypothetical protein